MYTLSNNQFVRADFFVRYIAKISGIVIEYTVKSTVKFIEYTVKFSNPYNI